MAKETMKGILFIPMEQEEEDLKWAFQDEKYIYKDESIPDGKRFDYRGRHILRPGDYLKVTALNGKIIFEGRLVSRKTSKKSSPVWYPEGIGKKAWMKIFMDSTSGKKSFIAEFTPA